MVRSGGDLGEWMYVQLDIWIDGGKGGGVYGCMRGGKEWILEQTNAGTAVQSCIQTLSSTRITQTIAQKNKCSNHVYCSFNTTVCDFQIIVGVHDRTAFFHSQPH